MANPDFVPRIRQVQLLSFKSIASAKIDLGPMTVLVGPNGSGKSNFIEALEFVRDVVSGKASINSLSTQRGSIIPIGNELCESGFRVIVDLEPDLAADYAFEVSLFRGITKERCLIRHGHGKDSVYSEFKTKDGQFEKEIPGIRPKLLPSRLALSSAAAVEEFSPLYDYLLKTEFYSIATERIREDQRLVKAQFLSRNGDNAASILDNLFDMSVDNYDLLCELLPKIVPGIYGVGTIGNNDKKKIGFMREDFDPSDPLMIDAANMSEGTLRAFGILLAVFQPNTPTLIAIEEPEANIHPAAAEIIAEVLLNASKKTQVIVATHSPDILDYKGLNDDQFIAVTMQKNKTLFCPLSATSRQAILERLYTPGELMRSNELNPDIEAGTNMAGQVDLFGKSPLLEDQE